VAVRTRPRSDVQINLLPPQIQARQRVRRAFRLALGGAAVLGAVLLGVTVLQRLQIADEREALRQQEAKAASLTAKVNELKDFDTLRSSAEETQKVLAVALTNDVSWSRFLDDLDTVIPGDSWVGNLTVTAKPGQTALGESSLGTAAYQGFVTSMPGLANWLDTMEKLDGLRFVYLSSANKQQSDGGPEVVSFSANAHLTESMLSGRCQKEGALCP
jgi:Tfp pilus assembly protein PilN